ncbi:MAG: TonB-dependent receptor [Rhodocyclaceae bacterium]|nr:TonB-dependent receptor [Rhodocyclaceae bacterium]
MRTRNLAKVALLPFLIQTAYAADSSVFTLGEVVVSAPGTGNIGSSTITTDEMRTQDRDNVATALNLESGVYFTKGGARNEQMVNVRGFDLRQVPIYMDGIPIYVPYDGYVDLARFSTQDLSRIEVSKGFSSALYGANTLGGAINLVSRKPTKAFEGEIGGGITFTDRGDMSGQQIYTNVGTNQGMWYLQAGVSYNNQDFYPMSRDFVSVPREDGGKRNWSDQNDSRINLKVGLTPNATDEYAFNYIKQKGTKNTPPYTGNQLPAGQANRYWNWPYWEKESFYFLSKTEVGIHTFRVRLYNDQFRNALLTYSNAARTAQQSSPSAYDDYTNGFSLQDDIRILSNNVLKVAYNYKEDVHRESTTTSPTQNFKDKTQTFAIEDTHKFNERLTLATGISYETRDTLQAQDYQNNKLSDFQKGDNSATNGQAALLYKATDLDSLRFSIARKSRFATIKDRYSYRFGTALPNPDLKPEQATHYEVGYERKVNSNLVLTSNLFYSRVTDMIQSITVTPGVSQAQNIGKVDITGIELGLNGSLGKVDFGANYTYLDRDNRSSSAFLTDTPDNKLFAYTTWNINGNWRVNGSVESSSRRYSSSDGKQIAPGFAVVNAKAGYKFGNGLLLEGGVRNLFDKNYMYTEGYPEAGRVFFAQFNMPL